jgi:SAM-dependent methyltransferase
VTESPDAYESGECGWWHLSEPSPELVEAVADGWLRPPGPAVDLGCGLGVEAGYLAGAGCLAVGVDISAAALQRARRISPRVHLLEADVRHLPFRSGSIRFLVDRGCFHYVAADDRRGYEQEARRVLVPGGRLLLRASLREAGVRNDIDEDAVRRTFDGWHFERIEIGAIPSDTRAMDAFTARLEAPT